MSTEAKTTPDSVPSSEDTKKETENSNKDKNNDKVNKNKKDIKYKRAYKSAPEGMQKVSRKETGNTKQRVAVLFGYVGTGYYGLQWDDKGEYPTIEKDLEMAIYKMGGILETNHGNLARVQWARGSRTDKGVHALGNVISLFMELPPDAFNGDKLGLKVADKINENLPPAIRVFSVVRVTRKFSPREQCAIRTYNLIWPRKFIDENSFSLEAIAELMHEYEGHHDFHNFTRAQHCYRPVPDINLNTTSTSTSTSTTSTSTTPSDSEPSSTTPTTTSATTNNTTSTTSSTTTTSKPDEKKDYDSSDDELPDDLGGEAGKDKKGPKKPKGQKAPPKREDQIKYFVPHPSYTRRMIYVGPETPFELEGQEWIPFKFVGESFAYNQIRKMLGFVLHIAQKHVPPKSLSMALNSPFKIHVPMTPGASLYLLGGTYLDRQHCLVDLFDFLPEGESISGKFDKNSKALRWHHLLSTADTSTALGAIVLKRMRDFRDDVLHPHISQLMQTTKFCEEFLEGIQQDRFKITDFEHANSLFEVWEKEEKDRKEKKRQYFAEREEALLKKYRLEEGEKENIAEQEDKEN